MGSLALSTGKAQINNAATNFGLITINSNAVLQLGDGVTNTGSVIANILDNNSLIIANPAAFNYVGNISGSGSLTKNGAGDLTLSGNGSFGGGITVNAGQVIIGTHPLGASPLGSAGVALSGGNLTLQGSAGTSGLTGKFFNNSALPNVNNQDTDYSTLTAMNSHWNSVTPTTTIASTTTGGKVDFNFSTNAYGNNAPFNSTGATTAAYGFGSTQNYELRFDGFFIATIAGTYTFATTSDDGSVLFLDGADAPLVNNNAYQGATRVTGSKFLTVGPHAIAIGYYQGTGGQGLLVDVTPPDTINRTLLNTDCATSTTINATQPYGNNLTINANTTFNVTNSLAASFGTMSVGSNTVSMTGSASASLATGNVTLTGSPTFDAASGTTLSVAAILGTTQGITKTDSGTMVLTGAATYTGPTQVNGGTLQVSNLLFPAGVPQPQVWFDASATSTVIRTGSNVTAWNNRSGNGLNVTAGAQQPTFNPGNANFYGLPTVTFAASQNLSGYDATFLNGSSYTIFAVEGKSQVATFISWAPTIPQTTWPFISVTATTRILRLRNSATIWIGLARPRIRRKLHGNGQASLIRPADTLSTRTERKSPRTTTPQAFPARAPATASSARDMRSTTITWAISVKFSFSIPLFRTQIERRSIRT